MPIDDADIQWLLSVAEAEDLAEIEVRDGEHEVLVRRRESGCALATTPAGLAPTEQTQAALAERALPEDVAAIVAPMSGVFYLAASPESPPYVEVGQKIEQGDIVGLIEAMKLFNDVAAQVSGTVTGILVENETHVEAGRRLILVDTST